MNKVKYFFKNIGLFFLFTTLINIGLKVFQETFLPETMLGMNTEHWIKGIDATMFGYLGYHYQLKYKVETGLITIK